MRSKSITASGLYLMWPWSEKVLPFDSELLAIFQNIVVLRQASLS